jgi:hypothetical protein
MDENTNSDSIANPSAPNVLTPIPQHSNLRLDLVKLTDEDVAEATRLGIDIESLKTAKAVQRARDAASIGVSVEAVAGWEKVVEDARRSGRGITQSQWAEATGRNRFGRFIKPR